MAATHDPADELLNMFQTLGTDDHGNLVNEFCSVCGTDPGTATFFLEANNWNMNTATAMYFESGNTQSYLQQQHPPSMQLVADTTIPNKDCMTPGLTFRQSWRIANNGDVDWPASTMLVPVSGDEMEGAQPINVPLLSVGEQTEISITLKCPRVAGSYVSSWKMCCNEGIQLYFGELIWVVVNVVDGTAELDEVDRYRFEVETNRNLDSLESAFSNL